MGCYPDKMIGNSLPVVSEPINIYNKHNTNKNSSNTQKEMQSNDKNNLTVPVIKSTIGGTKLDAPQQTIDGETRKKVALGKGYSLMDWIRTTRDSADLSGTNGIPRQVTHDELIKHNTDDDCWTVLYGIYVFTIKF